MSKNAIIVGMPRSGTSMTTNIFANCGYFIAENESKDLRSGDEFNPSGYWEAEPLIKANAEIFSSAGYPHDNTWLYDRISSQQKHKIHELEQTDNHKSLVDIYNTNSPWVWKDPRLCYTIGYWWSLMDKDTTRVLLLKRDHEEIYNSFIRLKWRKTSTDSKTDVFKRINDHICAAEEALKKYDIPHITVNYADFKTDPEKTAELISNFFDLNLSSEDLGFKQNLNTSSLQGKLIKLSDSLGNILPDPIRKLIKKLIPGFLWKLIYPHRYTK